MAVALGLPWCARRSRDSRERDSERIARVTATTSDIDKAAGVLRAGGLVAFPTETVYGLGADA
ncbi:Sua5/YciO/YrdC/YwlC family protein, partial [Spongiactinospora sp. 9N601]|uniref:Sua5/YciO/YrdC/YwlC family protein n=1 Tax=Spongiactinospora sp. 9N601 TaxID=3375149 RepID=UPI00378B54A8